ncbi:hypothetical protein MRB53_040044 [Persea americana]|nr:hypothetical protein MRB53_040044 [Persea americana]
MLVLRALLCLTGSLFEGPHCSITALCAIPISRPIYLRYVPPSLALFVCFICLYDLTLSLISSCILRFESCFDPCLFDEVSGALNIALKNCRLTDSTTRLAYRKGSQMCIVTTIVVRINATVN